jgi:transposase
MSLPPASPELNPTEQVWELLKDRELSNRCFKDEEDIIDCCCKAWNNFTDEKEAVRNLCSRKWANL